MSQSHHGPADEQAIIEARRREIGAHTENHGHSVAAWTGVATCLLGSLVGAIGVLLANLPLFWTGLAVMALSGLLGKFLAARGYGQGGHPHQSGKPTGGVR
jgi:hypothetical protein